MLRVIGTVLLALYSWVLFKPLYPVIYFAAQQEYVQEVLCINRERPQLHCEGKCFLKERLSENYEEKSDSPHNSRPSVEAKDFVIAMVAPGFHHKMPGLDTRLATFYVESLHPVEIYDPLFRPS